MSEYDEMDILAQSMKKPEVIEAMNYINSLINKSKPKQKTYLTYCVCSSCGYDLDQRLTEHVFTHGGNDFEHTCPMCGAVFEVEVEPIPAFKITKK